MNSTSTILIVDDYAANRETLLELLDSPDYRLVEAADGLTALASAAATPPDLVLLDVMMPGLDGYEVCRRLRADELLAEVPVIMITALDDQASRLAGIEAGADDFLTKPFHRAELRARVRTITRLNRYRRLHQAQERVREQAQWLDEARDAIFVRDLEQRIVYWNQGAERLYGWKAAEARGRTAPELFHNAAAPANDAALAAALATGAWQGEVRKVNRAGQKRTVASRLTLLRDPQGRPAGVLAIDTDITEQKEVEARFLRTQRLESIGTLAGGVAHDLNNVLAPILMSAQLLRMQSKGEAQLRIIDTVEQSAQRGSNLVRQILSFARGLSEEKVLLQPTHLIRDMISIARSTFPRTLTIKTALPPGLMTTLANATQIEQVLLNLCVNARDAMPQGGTLTLGAENVLVDEATAARHPGTTAGPHVCLRVTDSGTGMPPELLEKIFAPFFTTKEPGQGTGLGLATVQTIVREHNGFLTVESSVGQGTTFRVFLPASLETGPETGPAARPAPPRGHGELVLVVDDEGAVREMIRRILEASGYTVVVAEDPMIAVREFSQRKDEVRLVLTDYRMPMLDGLALVQILRGIHPAVRVLLATGSAGVCDTDGEAERQGVRTLAKPFTAQALLLAVHEVMGAEGK